MRIKVTERTLTSRIFDSQIFTTLKALKRLLKWTFGASTTQRMQRLKSFLKTFLR